MDRQRGSGRRRARDRLDDGPRAPRRAYRGELHVEQRGCLGTPGRDRAFSREGSMNHPTIPESIEFMRLAHGEQVDKGGNPYYLHPICVSMRLLHPTTEMRHASLLHDVVEDTSHTLEDLRAKGYSERVI